MAALPGARRLRFTLASEFRLKAIPAKRKAGYLQRSPGALIHSSRPDFDHRKSLTEAVIAPFLIEISLIDIFQGVIAKNRFLECSRCPLANRLFHRCSTAVSAVSFYHCMGLLDARSTD
jgi:hypothetical protein